MNNSRLITLYLIFSLVSGCAVMSEEECNYSDWTAVGYEDGADGRGSDRFGDYRRACADYGVTPDFAAWQAGRERGLVEYCQPSRGFAVGQAGVGYNGVCSAELEPAFLDAYRLGAELFGLRRNLNAIVTDFSSNARAMERIDADIEEIESIIILEETTAEERAALLADMRELSELRGELEVEAELLIEARTLAELELAEFEESLLQYGF